jgi:hypothetical protein
MTEPDWLYTSAVPSAPDRWVSIGSTRGGVSYTGDVSPDGTLTETVRDYATGKTIVTETASATAPEWTIGDALHWLDPKPKRRTVARWLKEMTPTGERSLPQGGPPARTYRAAEIIRRHARWAKTYGGQEA